MKKLFLALLLASPIMANANSLVFNATGDNFLFSGYNGDPVAQTGNRNVGQFGSFSIVGTGGGKFTATFLGDESGYDNNYFQNLSLGNQVMNETVAIGSSVSANIAGPGLIDFGFFSSGLGSSGEFSNGDTSTSVLGFVVLKEFVAPTCYKSFYGTKCSVSKDAVKNAGYNNGEFDFLIGFNDKFKSDADYDDYVIGIKYTPNAVPVPAALPLMATAIGLFGFAANRRRV